MSHRTCQKASGSAYAHKKQISKETHAVQVSLSGLQLGSSIHPLLQVVAGLELSLDLSTAHGLVLGQILGILPLKELLPILGLCLTAKVAISGGLLVLGLAESKRQG